MLRSSSLAVALVLLSTGVTIAQSPREFPNGQTDPFLLLTGAATPSEQSDYWLGIECFPVPAAVRTQLDLAKKDGLLVEAVAPESPAAKAGIVRHDVLLRVGDKPLTGPQDLIKAVEAAKEGKLKIDLIRGGKPKTLEVTPAKRPKEARRADAGTPAPGDWEAMQKWMDRMMPGEEGEGRPWPSMRFRIFHPGAIVPKEALIQPPLPANMSIVISKEGDQPTKIVVKRGDEKWEVTEKGLDKLPADIRPHVERMLGHGAFGLVGGPGAFDFVPQMTPPEGRPENPAAKTEPSRPGDSSSPWENRLDGRLEQMDRRIDKITRAVEAMLDGHAQPATPNHSPEEQEEK